MNVHVTGFLEHFRRKNAGNMFQKHDGSFASHSEVMNWLRGVRNAGFKFVCSKEADECDNYDHVNMRCNGHNDTE